MPTRFNRRLRHQRQNLPKGPLHVTNLTPNGISATPTPFPARGAVATALVHFSGVAANPGNGGWGMTCSFTLSKAGSAPSTTQFEASGPLGICTRNVAEYFGLLGALRALLRHLQVVGARADIAEVQVKGDAEAVLAQMRGELLVREDRLQVLQEVVKSVERSFGRVVYLFEKDNETAQKLADTAREMDVRAEQKAIYSPSVLGLAKAKVEDVESVASHDLGTSGCEGSWFVDAKFLKDMGNPLNNLQDTYPLSVVGGRVRMNVVGCIDLDVRVKLGKWGGGRTRVIVVDELPVPVHCSVRGGAKLLQDGEEVGIRELREMTYGGKAAGGRYSQHEFWKLEGEQNEFE